MIYGHYQSLASHDGLSAGFTLQGPKARLGYLIQLCSVCCLLAFHVELFSLDYGEEPQEARGMHLRYLNG